MATDHVQVVDQAAFLEAPGDLDALGLPGAAGKAFVRRVSDAEDEVLPDPHPDRLEDVEAEAHAIVERAVIGAVELVGQRRHELVDQVAVGLQLDAVHAARLHALRRVGEILDDALDVPVFQLLGKGAVRRLAMMRGSDHGKPVALVPARAPAEMGELDHDRRTLLVHGVGHLPYPGHDLVLVGEQVVEDGWTVLRHGGGACRHRQGHAPPLPVPRYRRDSAPSASRPPDRPARGR